MCVAKLDVFFLCYINFFPLPVDVELDLGYVKNRIKSIGEIDYTTEIIYCFLHRKIMIFRENFNF